MMKVTVGAIQSIGGGDGWRDESSDVS